MKKRHLLSASLLLLLASCTSDEIISTGGTGTPAGEGAVVFSLEGLGTGSVQNPGTRAGAVLATEAENRIDSLDIYVFAYDNDGTFNENLAGSTYPGDATQIQLTPPADADVANNAKWYLQEKWTYKDPTKSSGRVDTSKPQFHQIAALGGSGVARTAVIYPTRGRYLKFFIVANGGKLTNNTSETEFVPMFTDAAATPAMIGTKADAFLNLRLRLTQQNPADATLVDAIHCPLPMTAQMAATKATAVNMTASAPTPVQSTCKAELTRAVARFDVLNYAGYQAQGDYELRSVIVSGHHRYTNMTNVVPAASAFEQNVTHQMDRNGWTAYTEPGTGNRAKLLSSAFYTSPTLAGTDPMVLGLRGVLGGTTAKPGDLLTPLNKDVKVMDPAAPTNALVLKANYRYVLQIKKLGSDINVAFSILDWDSKVLDADFSNAPQPKLISTNSADITWSVADADMNKHSVTMANTNLGQRLAFELGTYNDNEMAALLLDPTNPALIPFEISVVSLNDDPTMDYQPWLASAVITFDQTQRDRFKVALDVRPAAEVPLYSRPDLMVMVVNKEHQEKQLFFRVKSTWAAPVKPGNGPLRDGPAINGETSYTVDMGTGTTPAYVAPQSTFFPVYDAGGALSGYTEFVSPTVTPFGGHCPAGWGVPTLDQIVSISGATAPARDGDYWTAKDGYLLVTWPSKLYWTTTEVAGDNTRLWAFTTRDFNGKAEIVFEKKLKTLSAVSRCIQLKP